MPSHWLDIHMATPQLSMVQTVVQYVSHSAVACCLLIAGLLICVLSCALAAVLLNFPACDFSG